MPWPAGTNPANNLKGVLAEYLTARLKSAPYKAQMPRTLGKLRSFKVYAPTGSEKINTSIKVLLYTGPDEIPPHQFNDGSGQAIEESHRITIDVRSDEKGARANEDAIVADILRRIFNNKAELAALINLGVYNVRESMDELQINDVEFNRTVNLVCSTDTYI